ncbi:hypothetical protein RCIP0072_00038 [Klebsiella phage RCIP0072]|jgi:hypothetical protein|uniref:DUF3310 domain-containing protein n=1 Tax=Klebsiella phage FK1979 TaxID=2936831 RepID=A0AAE9HG61_9CAUD|nr:hypothetical protein HCLLCEGK_00025 [Klebsiella phage FK1979]WJZ48824.1 nucleotide kinase [Klebsiella phage vB_KpnP_Ou2]
MSELKVGDKVVRKRARRDDNWRMRFKDHPEGAVHTITATRFNAEIIELDYLPYGWDVDHFDVVSTPSVPEALPTPKAPDAVNSPQHYASGGVECINAIKASMSQEAFKGYLKGNVQKYLWRYEKKVAPLEDLHKAQVYLRWLIEENQP